MVEAGTGAAAAVLNIEAATCAAGVCAAAPAARLGEAEGVEPATGDGAAFFSPSTIDFNGIPVCNACNCAASRVIVVYTIFVKLGAPLAVFAAALECASPNSAELTADTNAVGATAGAAAATLANWTPATIEGVAPAATAEATGVAGVPHSVEGCTPTGKSYTVTMIVETSPAWRAASIGMANAADARSNW